MCRRCTAGEGRQIITESFAQVWIRFFAEGANQNRTNRTHRTYNDSFSQVRWPGWLRPDGDEVIPLVEVLADGGFEGADDFLGELAASGAVAKPGAIIRDRRHDMDGIAVRSARNIDWHQGSAGGASQLSGGHRSGKRTAKQFDRDGGRGWRAVHQ